jgi:hypothetical protein
VKCSVSGQLRGEEKLYGIFGFLFFHFFAKKKHHSLSDTQITSFFEIRDRKLVIGRPYQTQITEKKLVITSFCFSITRNKVETRVRSITSFIDYEFPLRDHSHTQIIVTTHSSLSMLVQHGSQHCSIVYHDDCERTKRTTTCFKSFQ